LLLGGFYDKRKTREFGQGLGRGWHSCVAACHTYLAVFQFRAGQQLVLNRNCRPKHITYCGQHDPAHRVFHIAAQRSQGAGALRQIQGDGAVSMVEMALEELESKKVVNLDEERKAAMVSNLLVVLCAEAEVTPVINTGTLYK